MIPQAFPNIFSKSLYIREENSISIVGRIEHNVNGFSFISIPNVFRLFSDKIYRNK